MRHQVHDLHRSRGRRCDEGGLARGHQTRQAGGVDAEVLPRRNVRGDIIVQAERAFLDQHHQRDRGDRLAHGIDAEDRILAHRLVAFEVHAAGHAGMGELAPPIDHGQHAWQAAAVHVATLHHVIEARQSRRRQPNRFGFHNHTPVPVIGAPTNRRSDAACQTGRRHWRWKIVLAREGHTVENRRTDCGRAVAPPTYGRDQIVEVPMRCCGKWDISRPGSTIWWSGTRLGWRDHGHE